MHSYIFSSPVEASLGRYELFDLASSGAALLGVGRQGGFSSRKDYTCPSGAVGFFVVGFVLFYGVYSEHMGLLEKT